MGPGLVGRHVERSALSRLLEAGGGLALVSGEAGIGKSALLAWLAQDAARRGWLVLRAFPAEAERGLPFAGLADLLGPHLAAVRAGLPGPMARALDAAVLQAEPPAGGRADLAVRLGVLEALRALSRADRCVVIVDDVQWLDVPTAQGLGFAVRRLGGGGPVVVFGCRAGSAVPAAIQELVAVFGAAEVALGPMSVDELAQLVAERARVAMPDPAASALHHTSGGNPLFALELARALPAAQLPEAGGGPPPVPTALRGLLQTRMQALSVHAQRGMLLVAAAGQLHASDLAGLLGRQQAQSCLAEAADAGVLAAEGDGMLRFSHPLLAGLAYADARAADRRAAHARLAGHVRDPERRAWHLAASLTVPDSTAASELAAASRIAAARGAVHTAAELAERARQLTPAVEEDSGWERGLAAAQLYDAASEPGRAGRLLRHLAQTAPTPSHQARALLELSDLAGHDLVAARALAEEAVALAGEDRPVTALALGQLGSILLMAGDVPAAKQALNHAVDVSRATGNADAELRALHTLVNLELYAGTSDLSPVLAAVERAAASASAARGYLHPATRAGLVSLVRDEPEAARRVLLTALTDAEQAGDYAAARGPMLLMVQSLLSSGDLTAATEALARLQRWDPYGEDAPLLHVIALLAAWRGDCQAAVEAATRGAELARRGNDTRFLAANLSVLGFLEVSRGEFAAALVPLRETRSISRQLGIREPGVLRWHEDHIEASLAAGFLDEAAEITVDLQAQADALGRPGLRALAARCAGLVQAAGGDTAQAAAILAAAAHPGAEQPFEHARTLPAYGTVARRARRKAAARQALTAAHTSFTTIGTLLWARRADSELRRVGLRTTPGTLTETERRIAELASTGYTNREVAAELFLSVKTVEANLSRIYHKLQIRSRTQLARALTDRRRP